MDSVFTLQKRKLRHRKRKELAAQGVAELGPEPKLLTPGLDFSPCPPLLPLMEGRGWGQARTFAAQLEALEALCRGNAHRHS